MIHVYKVVQLRNGRFWSLHYPHGQPRIHACTMWGPGATDEKIRHDVKVMCQRTGLDEPQEYRVKTVHAEIVEVDS